MEWHSAGQDLVRLLQHVVERLHGGERAVGDRVEVREVDHGADPRQCPGDGEDVLGAAQVAHSPHDLDAEVDVAIFALESLAQFRQLLDDRGDGGLALAAEQEPGVEDDHLRAGGLRDPGRVVEHAHCHPLLLVALDVAHEARDGRVHGERDPGLARQLPELLGPRVVHPEAALEVDLAGGVLALFQDPDRLRRRLAGRDTGGAETELSHRPAFLWGS